MDYHEDAPIRDSRGYRVTAPQWLVEVLLSEGAGPGNSIHSWRCEYPDRYGPCTCVDDLAQVIAAALTEQLDVAGMGTLFGVKTALGIGGD